MNEVKAQIGTHIVVDSRLLTPQLNHEITQALTIPNPDKPIALREHLQGAHSMPDTIELLYREGSLLRIPRGFIHSFVRGMKVNGVVINWQDDRAFVPRQGPELQPIILDDYQELGCVALLAHWDAMISAPTGAGKTMIALEAIRRSMQRAIIIVEKASLGVQWVEEIRDKLGYDAGYIGEGQWVEREITVALRQSLWAHRATIDNQQSSTLYGFWQRWGMVLLDEAHHAPANTLVDLMQRFTAAMRGGVSATLNRDPLTFPIALAVIGPVVHETTFEEAEARLVRPRVRVIPTGFTFPDYHPTHKEKVWSDERGKYVTKTIRNNYGEMMAALIHDEHRNGIICDIAMNEALAGHHCLIVSNRKQHLEILRDWLLNEIPSDEVHWPLPMVFTLFGGAHGSDSTSIGAMIMSARGQQGTILLSTVADEGLNIPRLDRIFLAFPSRKVGGTKQKIGRITRRHDMKSDTIVYDFIDKQDLLKDQFRERRQMFYNKEGLEVEMLQETAI